MGNLDSLLLLSGNDIPFYEAQVVIHQPTLKEIGYIGEETLFTGLEMLNFSKDILTEEDKANLKNQSNFDILIAILKEQNAVMQKNRNCVEMVLALIFPEYMISIDIDGIKLKEQSNENEIHLINNDNFEQFKIILNSIFSYKNNKSNDLNPAGDLAKKIADKIKKRHQKLSELKKDATKIDILSRYTSILTVGQRKDMNSILNYTMYQLFDEFERYRLKEEYDIYLRAKMAGAQDLKDIDDWMKDIYSDKN